MAILYVAAEAMELKPLAGLLTGLRKLKWPIAYAYEGISEGRRIMLAANGAGSRLSVQAVEVAIRAITAAELSSSKLEAVVSTGFCGALDPDLRENQIVVGTEVLNAQTGEKFPCSGLSDTTGVTSGLVITNDRIANTAAEKEQLRAVGAIAVEIEAAAVAAHATRAGLPFSCIKVVSDRADESFPFDLNQMRTTGGHIARGKISLYALTHPTVIPELLRLKRRAGGAAKALGEFLATCRIYSETDSARTE